jgi:hypothetical protein
MRIYSFSKVLSLPFILSALYFAAGIFGLMGSGETWYIIIPVVALVVIYTFYPQIDYWWLKKYPPVLEQRMKTWFENHLPYYNAYSDAQRGEFDKRICLYVEAREFKSVGEKELKEVPYDIKCIQASQGVRLCLRLPDYLIKNLDRIYSYKHPFPSPRFQFLHTIEHEIEDGILISSLEHALPGITNPDRYYNIMLHGYAEAFVLLHPNMPWPTNHEDDWQKLELIHPVLSKDNVTKTTGFASLDLMPVHIVAFYEFNNKYKLVFEKEYDIFAKIFNITE